MGKNIKIGYCPTMEEYINNINNIQNFEIINLGSAARVLYSLSNNEIDVAVIGRKAKKREFEGHEKITGPGYTLIANSKGMVLETELKNLRIDTAISKEVVEKEFPELKNVVYHKTLQDALEKADVQLITWDDWGDKFELLIPVDEFNNKNKKFRVPHLYSKKEYDFFKEIA